MAYIRRQFKGNSSYSDALLSGITNSSTAITLKDGTTFPDGSVGPFVVTIDPGNALEEKVLVTTRSGANLQSCTRAYDGTTAQVHAANAIVQHSISAVDLDEANQAAHQLLGGSSTNGQIPYVTGAGTYGFVAAPTAGQLLGYSAGVPGWIANGTFVVAGPAPSGDATGAADVAAIQAAMTAASSTTRTTILRLSAGATYTVRASQMPGQAAGTGSALYGVPGVILDLNGSRINVTTALAGRADGIVFGFTPAGGNQSVVNTGVRNGTIDGTGVGTAGFGSAIRWGNGATTGSDCDFRDLVLSNWTNEWGISWGGMGGGDFQRCTVENVQVRTAKFGGVWFSLTDYATVRNLYADGITGNAGSGEGCVLEVESGNFGDFSDIKGVNVPISMLLLSGSLRATFRGIKGTCAAGADGIRLVGASNVDIEGVDLTGNGGGGTGLSFLASASNASNITVRGVDLAGFTNDISQAAYTGGATLDAVAISDFNLRDATAINFNGPVTGLTMTNGTVAGASNHWLVATNTAGIVQGVVVEGGSGAFFDGGGNNLVIRNCPGVNPVGVLVVAVPATGVAVAASPYDRTFYVTTVAGTTTCSLAIQNGPIVTLVGAVAQVAAVRVPAGKTLTPTYTGTAPTWVVEGE